MTLCVVAYTDFVHYELTEIFLLTKFGLTRVRLHQGPIRRIGNHHFFFFRRSVIVCEDSDQLMHLIQNQEGVDVAEKVTTNDKGVELEALRLNEVETELPHVKQQILLQQQQQQRRPRPPFRGRRPRPPPPHRRPERGFLGALRGRFPFLF